MTDTGNHTIEPITRSIITIHVRDLEKHQNAVVINRNTKWGNPFRIGKNTTRDMVISRYFADILQKINYPEHREKLMDGLQNAEALACHCSPLACHGDVLSAIVQVIRKNIPWRYVPDSPTLSRKGEKWFCAIGDLWFESTDLYTVVYHTLHMFQRYGISESYPLAEQMNVEQGRHVSDFIEFLKMNGYSICKVETPQGGITGYYPVYKTSLDWVLELQGIDKNLYEQEQQRLLGKMRHVASQRKF